MSSHASEMKVGDEKECAVMVWVVSGIRVCKAACNERPRAIFRFSRFGCAGKGEMLARRCGEESSIDVLEGRGADQYSKIKNIQTRQRGHRVRVGMNSRCYYGPWRCTLERAQEDLVIMHTCRGWITKKTKLLELLKEAGNGVVRRGGRKPADGVPKLPVRKKRINNVEGLKKFVHSWKSVETSFLSLLPSPHLQSFILFACYLLLATSFFHDIPVVSALSLPFILP